MLGQYHHQYTSPSSNASSSMHAIPNAKVFGQSSNVASPSTAHQPLNVSAHMDDKSVKEICDVLNKQIESTKCLTEFSQVLQVQNINTPTISGHTDFYYPNLSYPSAIGGPYQQDLPEISKVKYVPLPGELYDQLNNQLQQRCSMGLFTAISRAWLIVDNLIFFWNYEDGSDICFYDYLTEPILAVELFVPKVGTFDDGIEYGLCLATESSVHLLSIDFIRYTKGNGSVVNEMRFSPQPVYSISWPVAENSSVNCIRASSLTGRIFMGASDGCLYEFFYQSQTGWLTSQTKRVNLSKSKFYQMLVPSFLNFNEANSIVQIELDESRQVLYTRSENSTIQVFYLGTNGQETSNLSCLSGSNISSKAASLINTNNKQLFTPIVHISPILPIDSLNISLVATCQSGIRLYFSINEFDSTTILAQQQYDNATIVANSQPSIFQLVHVRLPPTSLHRQTDGLPDNQLRALTTLAYSSSGCSLIITRRTEQTDSVLLLNRDLFLLHNSFKESKTMFDVDARVWCAEEIKPSLASIKTAAADNDSLQTAKSASNLETIPKLTAEFFELPRRFAMITPQGCYLWSKLRPVDQLAHVLREGNGPNSEGVRLFFNKIYERAEACALCLAVALTHFNDPRIFEWATQAYFIYSGDAEIRKRAQYSNVQPTSSYNSQPTATMTNSQSLYPPLSQYQQQYNEPNILPDQQNNENYNQQQAGGQDMSYLNPNRLSIYQQPPNKGNMFHSLSVLNSPQQMSTPINVRTKDVFGFGQGQQASRPSMIDNKPQIGKFLAPQWQSQQPQVQNHVTSTASSIPSGNECEVFFSGKHDALYLYLARLLAPIWDQRLLTELNHSSTSFDEATGMQFVFASFTEINIQWYLNKLNELRKFIDLSFPHLKHFQQQGSQLLSMGLFANNINMPANVPTSPGGQVRQAQSQQSGRFSTQFGSMALNLNALQVLTSGNRSSMISEDKLANEIEMGSIFLIRQFLGRCIEVCGLWKILEEHKFHFISAKLDKSTQQALLQMRIKNFLMSDDSLLEQLITALLYRYIDDNACTDMLNQSLKLMCPSLYTNENAIFSKAFEKLKQALSIKNDTYERETLLREAVDLMKQIGYVANLEQVCDMLFSAGCYEAIFELGLSAAEKRDPQQIALYYYTKLQPVEDVQGQHYYSLRMECYKCITDCLTALSRMVPNAQHRVINSKERLEEKLNQLIKLVISYKDQLAHVCVFNWMINVAGLENKLVSLDSPFLESFLIREIRDQAGSKTHRIYLDLLWRHYDFRKDYLNAAKILTALAEKYSESQITLKERVEYLTQAIVALNSSNKSSVKDDITELNDKKDVALLQEKIYDELSRLEPRTDFIQEALVQLNSQLYDITKLYYEFAEKFDMHECQLAILKTARHEDTKTIELLWKQIIANEMDKMLRPDIKPSELKTQLAENIVNIAREYVNDDEKYFPLGTLIDSLEFVSLSRGFEPEWGCTLLRKLGISFDQLIHAYDQVYLRKDIKWTENSSRFLNAIYCLVEIFTKAPNDTNETDKILFLKSVKDLIPKYLTELNAINDDLSSELINSLKTLSYMLERISY